MQVFVIINNVRIMINAECKESRMWRIDWQGNMW